MVRTGGSRIATAAVLLMNAEMTAMTTIMPNSARRGLRRRGRHGPPLHLELRATKIRQRTSQVFARYEFRFTQDDSLVYTGDQAAMWMKVSVS